MKIIDFIKNNKVPTIVASVVLVAAVAVGVTFGVMNHKDNIKATKPFGDESSSAGSSSTISVPTIEDNSSEVSASSEDGTSSASETIETNSTPSKAESVSSAQATSSKQSTTSSKPATSTPSNVTSSTPTASTPSNSTGGGNSGSSAPSNGGNTGTGSKWVCPDPSAHPQESAANCIVEYDHKSFVAQYQEQEANKDKIPTRNPEDVGKICWRCGKPYGDGYNGTCDAYFDKELDRYACHHYD